MNWTCLHTFYAIARTERISTQWSQQVLEDK